MNYRRPSKVKTALAYVVGGVFAAAGAALLVCFMLIASSLFGALAGFLVDWLFKGEVSQTLTMYGLPYVELWKVGATLGFVLSFFKSVFTTSTTVTNSA